VTWHQRLYTFLSRTRVYSEREYKSACKEEFNRGIRKGVEKLLYYPDPICLNMVETRVLGEAVLEPTPDWERLLAAGVNAMLTKYSHGLSQRHIEKTPFRVVKAFKEYFSGYSVNIKKLLGESLFPIEEHTQMIHVKNVVFHSVCAHHLALINGTAHFAYVPDKQIIGLSKIPRLIDALARRPQVQEKMTDQIVDEFMLNVSPAGCAVFVRANHACMQARGVKSQTAITETTALRGVFTTNPDTRQEFLMSVSRRDNE
jgi:GTP cyclohydrolase IA